MTQFFISYAHEDERWAKWIRWVLEQAHYTVVSQEGNFHAGENFIVKMRDGLRTSDKVILVLTPAFYRSKFAELESSAAMVADPVGHSRKIIPVMVEHCEVPLLDSARIYIDLHNIHDPELARDKLLGEISGASDQSGVPPPFPGLVSEPAHFPGGTAAPALASAERGEHGQVVDVDGFLRYFQFNDVTSIDVSALTGGMTVRALVNHLRRAEAPANGRKIPLRILFKSPQVSDRKRANDVATTARDVGTLPSWIEPEVRYFAAPAVLRSIVLHHENSSYSAFLSFYDWKHPENLPNRGAHSDYANSRKRAASDRLLEVYESWFRHYWGKRKLHTIIFDFDDTLFFTTEARLAAWNKAIQQSLSDKLIAKSELSKAIRAAIDGNSLDKALTEIFFDKQEDDDMLDVVFARSMQGDRRKEFVERRRKLRADETVKSAKEIFEITRYLPQLRSNYQLVIVSGTSESVVEAVLGKDLGRYFSFIVGSEAPTQNWEAIERKTQNLLRISAMLGVPLNRCAFIGDSDTDCRSANQLDLPFIENGLNVARLVRPSLIRKPAKNARAITGKGGPDELFDLLDEIDASIK